MVTILTITYNFTKISSIKLHIIRFIKVIEKLESFYNASATVIHSNKQVNGISTEVQLQKQNTLTLTLYAALSFRRPHLSLLRHHSSVTNYADILVLFLNYRRASTNHDADT